MNRDIILIETRAIRFTKYLSWKERRLTSIQINLIYGLLQLLLIIASRTFFQAYDQHLNMILGDVEEIITTVEIDDETYEEIVRVYCRISHLFFS